MASLVGIVALISIATVSSEPCTICTDGSAPEGFFGGIPCTDFEADLAATDADSQVCRALQLEAYQYCSCPSFPAENFCPLCDDGFFDIPYPRRPIVGWNKEGNSGTWLTCDDVLFGDMSQDGECARNELAAYYCGCPGATPPFTSSCSLCDEVPDEVSLELLLDDPDAPTPSPQVLVLDRRVPPMFDITCDDYRQAASLFTDDDCDELGTGLPVHLKFYCGCKLAPELSGCELCPTGMELLSDVMVPVGKTTVSCAEWDVVANAVTEDAYCTETIAPLRETCCQVPGEEEEEEEDGDADKSPVDDESPTDGDEPTEPVPEDESSSMMTTATLFIAVLTTTIVFVSL